MSEPFLLKPAEVAELTGATRRTGQLDWLARNGIPAMLGNDGKVKVLRAAVEAKLLGSALRQRPKTEPNLEALHGRGAVRGKRAKSD